MCDLGISEEDAKRYKSRSGKKITITCPYCNKKRVMRIVDIYKHKSIGCPCGDGKSYPEKFIMNLLEQLGLDFEIEYKPSWIDGRRYDFYIPKLEYIIETHGRQHYDGSFNRIGGRNLEEERANDEFKKETALANGIKHYTELDCKESNMDYIKNSILNSELSKLFDLSNIDWNKCAEFANKNIVKEVCDYWNNRKDGETTSDLGKVFKTDRGTIVNYLKKGTKLDWCKYNPKEELKKSALNNGFLLKKKVEIFKNNQSLGVFESCAELDRQSEELFGIKLCNSNISSCCLNKRKSHKGFTFKYVD